MKKKQLIRSVRHVYRVGFDGAGGPTYLIITDVSDPGVAVAKAVKVAAREADEPVFRYCEYVGAEAI